MFYSKQYIMSVIALLSFCSAYSMQTERALFVPSRLGNVALLHDDENGFRVLREQGEVVPVQRAHIDKELRGLKSEKLMGLVKASGYLKLNQMENDGEYTIKMGHRLPGGGVGGACLGAWICGGAVAAIGHGTIGIIALCSGPAGPAVAWALEFWFATPIAIAAKAAAVAGGIAGGVATGPV